jgi:hypothetical protein
MYYPDDKPWALDAWGMSAEIKDDYLALAEMEADEAEELDAWEARDAVIDLWPVLVYRRDEAA